MSDDWNLTDDQMFFLMQRYNSIHLAYENGGVEYLDRLEHSTEYRMLFGNMSLDEALDRYECTMEDEG